MGEYLEEPTGMKNLNLNLVRLILNFCSLGQI